MVRKTAHIFLMACFIVLLAQAAFAASFTATVDRNNVVVGRSFTLELRLSGANPKGAPNISQLEEDFTVYGTSQSSQTTIINNKVSSSINWNVTLIPKKEGSLTIPVMTVVTDEGKLKSKTITVNAGKASTTPEQGSQNSSLFVDTKITKQKPYKNEPVLLTAKLISRKSISDIELPSLTADNAIIEQQGDPEVYDGVLQGQRAKVIEVRYLITPLEAGNMKISGIVFQGKVASGKRRDPFSGGFSDPFGMFEDFGFASYEPFSVASDNITLEVKPPAAAIQPWLPAYMVKLSDEWEGLENARVGEPLTRKLTIIAQGLTGTALPNLESQIDLNGQFKIYSDKPVTDKNLGKDGKSVSGWREENYTLIPQKEGTITLPEIRLPWWDILNNKIAYATIPAKTIKVKGSTIQTSTPQPQQIPQPEYTAEEPAASPVQPQASVVTKEKTPTYLYAVITTLGITILIMAGLIIHLFRKLKQYKKGSSVRAEKSVLHQTNEDKISLSSLKKTRTAEELRFFLQNYAHQHWALPQNTSLQSIATYIKTHNPQTDVKALSYLDAALYAGEKIDIESMKKCLPELLKSNKNDKEDQNSKKIGTLNPS